MLVSTLQDPRAQISSDEWSSREWIYQEGILSNRKLVFTDHRVYWECRGMAIQENIYLPLRLVRERSGRRILDEHIRTFSARNLSYD
jgi:hypothetical protein